LAMGKRGGEKVEGRVGLGLRQLAADKGGAKKKKT